MWVQLHYDRSWMILIKSEGCVVTWKHMGGDGKKTKTGGRKILLDTSILDCCQYITRNPSRSLYNNLIKKIHNDYNHPKTF